MILETLIKPGINIKDIVMPEPKRAGISFDPETEISKHLFEEFEKSAKTLPIFHVSGMNGIIPLADLKLLSESSYQKIGGTLQNPQIGNHISTVLISMKSSIENNPTDKREEFITMLSLFSDSKTALIDIKKFDGLPKDYLETFKALTSEEFANELGYPMTTKMINNLTNLMRSVPEYPSLPMLTSYLNDPKTNQQFEIQESQYKRYLTSSTNTTLTNTWDLLQYSQLIADFKLLNGVCNQNFSIDPNMWDLMKNVARNITSENRNDNIPQLLRIYRNFKIISANKATINPDGMIILTENISRSKDNKPELPIIRNF